MAFYRTYRPQTIEELDSERLRRVLYSFFAGDVIPQTVLFTGPKGLGKTSAARIIAKVINCTGRRKNAKTIDPCNACDHCIAISQGSHLDVFEIDAASNRGIDEIRDLREKVKLSPVLAKKKVYIIDEVHMLTTEAFNALLKTLEEPPSHVTFILCTTELQKIPATILSRCFHIPLDVATQEELLRALERVGKAEKIKIGKEALNRIARLAQGSFRDGVKILEELSLIAGKASPKAGRGALTVEMIEREYRVSQADAFSHDLLLAFFKKDIKGGLAVIQKVVKQGIDMRYFIETLLETLHTILLGSLGAKKDTHDLDFTVEEIQSLADLLQTAHQKARYTPISELPLELALVSYSSSKPSFSTTDLSEPVLVNPSLLPALIQAVKPFNHSIAGVLRGCFIQSSNKGNLVIGTSYAFHKDRLEDPKVLEILQKAGQLITGEAMRVSIVYKPQKGVRSS